MKTLLPIVVLFSSTLLSAQAQLEQSGAAAQAALASAPALSQATAYSPVDLGRDHTTWERYRSETNRSGRVIIHTNRYVELETGKHYSHNGRWLQSREEIQIAASGAIATNGPHKVGFTANINSPEPVTVLTPDNKRLKIRPLGFAYFDFHSETNILIAELKDSGGLLVGTNQVLYPDAFTDFRADVRYTYKKSGLEQDVILRQRPPLPEAYGLNPNTTWLLVLTEFINPPADVRVDRQIRRGWRESTVDKVIKMGGMSIGQGTAFSLGLGQSRRAGVPVQKHWTVMDGRTILIEEVPFRRIVPQLRNLQASAEPAPGGGAGSTLHLATTSLLLPAVRVAGTTFTNTMQIASVQPKAEGLVLDFDLQSGTDVVLQGDQTYVVTDTVNLDNVVIEGGTVVKYAPGASINVLSNVQCLTGPYRPAIFTAVDDDSVGETVSGSTGNPSGAYADCALSLGVGGDLKYLNIRYANEAIYCINSTYSVSHSQFVSCNHGLHSEYANFYNGNVLMSQVGVPYCGSYFNGQVEHLTCDQASVLVQDWDYVWLGDCWGGIYSATLTLVNSLTAAIQDGDGGFPIVYDHVWDFPSGDGVFQTVGAGAYYLVDGSTNRNAGTPTGTTMLTNKTTYPPIVYSNVVISVDTVLGPRAQRDTNNAPDLGYHYDPLDYAFSSVLVTNAVFQLLPGTAVATFGFSHGYDDYGLAINCGSQLISAGTPTSLNHIAYYNMVQECASSIWNARGRAVVEDTWWSWSGPPPKPPRQKCIFSLPIGRCRPRALTVSNS